MARKKAQPDYLYLKKILNKYHRFTFSTPRKGKQFTPQQKAAISRKYANLREYISNDMVTWLPYPKGSKLPGVDGIRTNRGLFYKYPFASLKYSKKLRKWQIVIRPKARRGLELVEKRRDILFLFPPSVIGNPQAIMAYVEELRRRYAPHDIRWSTLGSRESVRYDESLFTFYYSVFSLVDDKGHDLGVSDEELTDDEVNDQFDDHVARMIFKKRKYLEKIGYMDNRWQRKAEVQDIDNHYYNGVFLIYYLKNK